MKVTSLWKLNVSEPAFATKMACAVRHAMVEQPSVCQVTIVAPAIIVLEPVPVSHLELAEYLKIAKRLVTTLPFPSVWELLPATLDSAARSVMVQNLSQICALPTTIVPRMALIAPEMVSVPSLDTVTAQPIARLLAIRLCFPPV